MRTSDRSRSIASTLLRRAFALAAAPRDVGVELGLGDEGELGRRPRETAHAAG